MSQKHQKITQTKGVYFCYLMHLGVFFTCKDVASPLGIHTL